MKFATQLPIDAVLHELRTALTAGPAAVLVAPPGAGKTTRVPLALMDESWLEGRKILVLEPRRIAARAAAARMAHFLSEAIGERIGLRARMVSKSGPQTRIEVVTEGVFTRMILDDPELSGIRRGAVRRVSRALARFRPQACLSARLPARLAGRPAHPADVGDAGRWRG
jgi:ATP-dependent helicase HrpB